MKIESLISGDLRIWMTDRDLDRWGLCLDDLQTASRSADRTVRRLLGVARQRIPFCSSGTVTVEILPVEGGLVFVFSAPPCVPLPPVPRVYTLATADDVLQLGEALSGFADNRPPYASLYRQGDGYLLIVYPGMGEGGGYRRVIGEFGTPFGEGAAAVARVEEYAHPIVLGDALHRLITAHGSRPPTQPHPLR